MTMTGLEGDVATAYRRFADREAVGNSPVYEELCRAISADDEIVRLISTLPGSKTQPNLVLGAARFLGAPVPDAAPPGLYDDFRAWLLAHWGEVEPVVIARATQTNEVGRCATVLPLLAGISGPIAVLEVGCSAGLNLFLDAYGYRFDTPEATVSLGDGTPVLTTRLDGFDAPTTLPDVRWRGGLDLNPLDVTNPDDVHWLEMLVWPGQRERVERLRAAARTAARIARNEPLTVMRGDIAHDLSTLLARVPDDLHLVLFHTAVLAYCDVETRDGFEQCMSERAMRPGGFTWISNEAPSVMPGIAHRLTARGIDIPAGQFVIAVDGEPSAFSGPHGQHLTRLRD